MPVGDLTIGGYGRLTYYSAAVLPLPQFPTLKVYCPQFWLGRGDLGRAGQMVVGLPAGIGTRTPLKTCPNHYGRGVVSILSHVCTAASELSMPPVIM